VAVTTLTMGFLRSKANLLQNELVLSIISYH
jgi:hypothetical protein